MSLEVRNLTKTYGDVRAVDHLSFEMPAPGAFGLIGTNGAGKTTTIRMMLGLLAADEAKRRGTAAASRATRSPSATCRRSAVFT